MHAIQNLFVEVWCQMYCLKYTGFEKSLIKKVLETVEEKLLFHRQKIMSKVGKEFAT